MGTTVNGWPYVEPTAHPLEYPPISQQLAQLLDTTITPMKVASATITNWSSGWADVGGGDGPATVIRQNRMIVVQALAKRTSDLTVVLNTGYPVCTLPAGFVPAFKQNLIGVFFSNSSPTNSPLRFTVTTAGLITVYFPTAFTAATNHVVTLGGALIGP